jgi:hypothetical protein
MTCIQVELTVDTPKARINLDKFALELPKYFAPTIVSLLGDCGSFSPWKLFRLDKLSYIPDEGDLNRQDYGHIPLKRSISSWLQIDEVSVNIIHQEGLESN